jgi:hypothetical protein
MDGIGRIAQRLFPELPRLEPKDDAKAEAKGFQAQAASLEISVKLNYLQLTGGDVGSPVANVQDLIDKVTHWIRDVFEKNGIEWKDLTPEEAQAKIDEGGDQAPDAVSKRILDFVKAFDDGTPGRAQLLRDAVEEGFAQAEGAWG